LLTEKGFRLKESSPEKAGVVNVQNLHDAIAAGRAKKSLQRLSHKS
jgi:hypothetical protein